MLFQYLCFKVWIQLILQQQTFIIIFQQMHVKGDTVSFLLHSGYSSFQTLHKCVIENRILHSYFITTHRQVMHMFFTEAIRIWC